MIKIIFIAGKGILAVYASQSQQIMIWRGKNHNKWGCLKLGKWVKNRFIHSKIENFLTFVAVITNGVLTKI